MCSAFHQGCYALFVCNKIRFGANQRPCLISTELGAPGEDIISSSHSGLVQPNCLKPLELWLRLYVYHLIQILGPNTIHKSSICEISTKWTWNKSRANTTRHVFHRPRGSSFEATSHGLRTETVLGSERMWSQYVAMTNWLSMSQMSQISQGHGDWLVVEAPTERNELFHEDLFPINDRIAETCGNYWCHLMSTKSRWRFHPRDPFPEPYARRFVRHCFEG